MQSKKRMKMCSNCDGMVDLDVIICPYCGFNLSQTVVSPTEKKEPTPPLEETISALYPPPYKPKAFQENEFQESLAAAENTEDLKQASSFKTATEVSSGADQVDAALSRETQKSNLADNQQKAASINQDSSEEIRQKKTIFSTLLFSLGVNLMLFSLFLLFFSKNGELFLRWDSSFWYLYSLIGMGLIGGGYKLLNKINS